MKTIQLSQFKRPATAAATKSVDYLEGSISDFISEINFVFKVSVAFLLALAMLSAPHYKVLADPVIVVKQYSPLKSMPQTDLQPLSAVSTVYLNKLRPYGTYANTYAAGNCTYYDASRLPIPDSWGNANTWDDAAQSQGYIVSATPEVGAIAQTDGDSYLGHVAIVEAIYPDGSFLVSEMNAQGLGVIDSRITNSAEFPHFIYP